MNTFQEILSAAQGLSDTERLELAHALFDTVPENQPPPSDEWMEEVRARSAALDAGTMPVFDWEDVRREARRQAGLDG